MLHFFTQVGSTIFCAGHPVAQIDTDRIEAALCLVSERHCSPLAAHLVACCGWTDAVARAYGLIGDDAAAVISRQDALAHGRARKLLQ